MHGVDVHAVSFNTAKLGSAEGGNTPMQLSPSTGQNSPIRSRADSQHLSTYQKKQLMKWAKVLALTQKTLSYRTRSTPLLALDAFEWLVEALSKDVYNFFTLMRQELIILFGIDS